ncbi:MAG: nitroreductase [Pseudomonadota bacterium]
MDVVEAIKTRKSIRNFKPDPVPKEIIREILEIACSAPSAMNTQPWEFLVISGDVIKNIKLGNIEKLNSGTMPNPERSIKGWPSDSIYKQRQVELAKQLFQLMDIQREDKEKRAEWTMRGFRYFEAPSAIFVLTDRSISETGPLMDVGAVMQTICLTALNYGLGTCIEDQGLMYPDVVRKYVDIPESKRIISTIAIGYPNWDFPANRVQSTREPLENITTWCGFE